MKKSFSEIGLEVWLNHNAFYILKNNYHFFLCMNHTLYIDSNSLIFNLLSEDYGREYFQIMLQPTTGT